MPFRLPARVLMSDAPALLAAGCAAVLAGERDFDLSALVECDSSVLACINQWRRDAAATGGTALRLSGVPDALRRIARLYGVEALTLA